MFFCFVFCLVLFFTVLLELRLAKLEKGLQVSALAYKGYERCHLYPHKKEKNNCINQKQLFSDPWECWSPKAPTICPTWRDRKLHRITTYQEQELPAGVGRNIYTLIEKSPQCKTNLGFKCSGTARLPQIHGAPPSSPCADQNKMPFLSKRKRNKVNILKSTQSQSDCSWLYSR